MGHFVSSTREREKMDSNIAVERKNVGDQVKGVWQCSKRRNSNNRHLVDLHYKSANFVLAMLGFNPSITHLAKTQCIIMSPEVGKTYLLKCTPNEDSNQPAHARSLIRVFVVGMKNFASLAIRKCAQWRFWSDCANAQADMNFRWAHFWWYVFRRYGSYSVQCSTL